MKKSRQIRAVMTADVTAVEPGMPVEAALAVLQRRDVGGAPVVGKDGRVLGFVTQAISRGGGPAAVSRGGARPGRSPRR